MWSRDLRPDQGSRRTAGRLVIPSKARDLGSSCLLPRPRFLALLGMTRNMMLAWNMHGGDAPKNLGDAFSVPF